LLRHFYYTLQLGVNFDLRYAGVFGVK